MSDAFTLRIYVPDGDPDGVRIVDRMNWTGKGLVIPRDRWATTRARDEFEQSGVYILSGYETGDDGEDQLALYIGQTDNLRKRIDQHQKRKDFWDQATVFISSAGLNRAHITWLEWALWSHAKAAKRSRLDNDNGLNEPQLSESEKADTEAFLKEVLRILPLVGLHAFEARVTRPAQTPDEDTSGYVSKNDTIIVPAKADGFHDVFLGQNAWWAIRISAGMVPKLRWIAAYQTRPESKITHIAEIDRIEPHGDTGKKKLIFKGPAVALENPVPFGNATSGAMQGPRYTTRDKLLKARSVKDLLM